MLEPHVLRQGAHLLAAHGHVDAAVERLGRAEALVGAEPRARPAGRGRVVLADHDRLEEAEPRLRASLAELRAAGLVDERVDTAGVLARALERAGRGEEAEEVWQRYGVRGLSQAPTRRAASQPSTWSRATRSCAIVSRSRIVTAWSSRVSKSTVMQYGVPISSWRR